MKFLKWFFLTILTLLVLLVAAGFVLSYFYKDEIVAKVKTDINKNFNATIDFGDVDLSFLRSFPDFNLQLNDLTVKGQEAFEGVTLADAKNIELDLDVMSVINADQPIKINTIKFIDPKIHVIVLKDGKANYDITKPSEEVSEESYNFVINLEEYNIENGQVIYDDRAGDLYLELVDLDHTGTGNFTETVFDLSTKTNIAEISAKTGGITYLRRAAGDLDMTLNANLDEMKFTLKQNELMVNALKLKADGFVTLLNNGDMEMDLTFDAPGNSFKNFLSLVPGAFTKDFQDVTANGQLALNGFAKGTYSATKNRMPAFKVFLDIKDGDFKYPGLPLGVKDVFANINVNSPSSDFDKMVVDIPNFKMNLGNNPFEARLNLKNPISDPDIDTKINGIINLSDLAKAFPMEGVETLNGTITADLTANTRMSYVDKQQYDRVKMDGTLKVEDLNYAAEGMPAVNIKTTDVSFTPQKATIQNFRATLGKSDIEARGTLDNILAYLAPEKTMTGDLMIRSNYFDLNEWIPEEEAPVEDEPAPVESAEVFDRFAFNIDAVMDKIDYDVYKLSKVSANGKFTPVRLDLKNFGLTVSKSTITGSGNLRNIFAYVFENKTLEGDININSDYLDLNQLMADMETGAPEAKTIANEELEPLVIPEGIAVNINAKADKVSYTNMELNNVDGKIVIADQAIDIKNATARTLGGKLNMDGKYDSKNAEKPGFDMDFKISEFSFQEAFDKLNTVKSLAPIAKFMEGKFDTNLKISGLMGKDMIPDLSTLTAKGFIQTLDAVLKSFKPLEKVGEKLNVSAFKNINIKNTKNWFTVEDGKVNISEFDYDFKDIAMKISGQHGFTQEMNYLIKAKVPRELLRQSGVGQAADKGIGFLSKEASKFGVNIAQGDFIDLDINLLGSITSPQIKIKPTGSGGKSFKETAKDQINEIKDQAINEAKEKVNEEVDKAKAAAKEKAEEELDKVKKKAEEEAKKQAKIAADKLKKHVQDSIATAAQKAVEDKLGEEAKDKLKEVKDKWNPFKKKKEGGGE